MADFINNHNDRKKLKIPFIRESTGVYSFGSKRVAIRIEKDKLNVRVGGGYLAIDDFIDQYTPLEMEKKDRKPSGKSTDRFNQHRGILKSREMNLQREYSPVISQLNMSMSTHKPHTVCDSPKSKVHHREF